MECFSHAGTGAVGVCVVCGKGLCRACAKVDGGWIHCEGECAQDATLKRDAMLAARNYRAIQRTGVGTICLFVFLAGAGLLIFGLVFGDAATKVLCIGAGGGFILLGLLLAVALRRFRSISTPDTAAIY